MPKVKDGLAPLRRAKHAVRSVLFRGRTGRDWHWFDHPEMQARIAEAEADRCEGRVTRMETPEAVEAYLRSLACNAGAPARTRVRPGRTHQTL